jgi:hypothetical protein
VSIFFGHGAGAATDLVVRLDLGALLTPVIPKALYEYGIVGAVPLLLFLGWLLLPGMSGRPWAGGLLLGYFLINAALLQATLALGTIVLIALFPALPPDRSVSQPVLAPRLAVGRGIRGRHRIRR